MPNVFPALTHVYNDPNRQFTRCAVSPAQIAAALAGMSLSDYLLNEIRQIAERLTFDELRARMDRRTRITPSIAPTAAIRAERERQ